MKIKLSTGKELYACNGVLGIGPEPDYDVCTGFDGGVNSYEMEHQWDDTAKPTDEWLTNRNSQYSHFSLAGI